MAKWREEIIGDCRLILGDCLEVLPTLPNFDACVTDPPYGIGMARYVRLGTSKAALSREYAVSAWDDAPVSGDLIQNIRSLSDWQIIFGGNYYELPPSSCWLVWDKRSTGNYADCELAWTNLPKVVRKIEWLWNGMIRKGDEARGFHPTQKPVGVMQWCIQHLPAGVATVLDPFMGSGTTGIACVREGKSFVGIEREPQYFETACRRIEQAYKQPDMFVSERPAAPIQQSLLEDCA